jgi:hypothetical protein
MNLNAIKMKKLNVPEGYEVYQDDDQVLYALDKHNMQLIEEECKEHQSYWQIPDDKEVECFIMTYNKATNTISVNFVKRVKMKMNLLKPHVYLIDLYTPKEKPKKKKDTDLASEGKKQGQPIPFKIRI